MDHLQWYQNERIMKTWMWKTEFVRNKLIIKVFVKSRLRLKPKSIFLNVANMLYS